MIVMDTHSKEGDVFIGGRRRNLAVRRSKRAPCRGHSISKPVTSPSARVPPAEFELAYYHQLEESAMVA